MPKHDAPDEFDLRILDLLRENARMDVTRIARRINKAASTTGDRIAWLVSKGYIRRFTAIVDEERLGRPTTMIVLVQLNCHKGETLRTFPRSAGNWPEVRTITQLSGEYDFMLQLSLAAPSEYQCFLDEKLCALPIVEKIQSCLVLKEQAAPAVLRLTKVA